MESDKMKKHIENLFNGEPMILDKKEKPAIYYSPFTHEPTFIVDDKYLYRIEKISKHEKRELT